MNDGDRAWLRREADEREEQEEAPFKALKFFTWYMDGIIVELELISRLAELPIEAIEMLPDAPEAYPPIKDGGLKARVLDLKDKIAKGETVLISGGAAR